MALAMGYCSHTTKGALSMKARAPVNAASGPTPSPRRNQCMPSPAAEHLSTDMSVSARTAGST